jgi:hypothetical protein
MQRKFAAIASVATALAASGAIAFGGIALAGGHGHGIGGHSDNDGGDGGHGGKTGVYCEFHGPVDFANHVDNPAVNNCSAVGASNGARGGNGY